MYSNVCTFLQLPTNKISRDAISNERNRVVDTSETDFRGSKKLDECKKLRSRTLSSEHYFGKFGQRCFFVLIYRFVISLVKV